MDEQRDLDKLRILMDAVNSLHDDETKDETQMIDKYGCVTDPFIRDLKEAAWNVLHDNPGCEFGDWQDLLIEQYPAEVVDALGNNPFEVFPALSDLWDTNDYEDPETGECHTFNEWAGYFATDQSVELYELLVEAKREIKALKLNKNLKR